jgi:dihydroneopterin aldolase
VDLRGKPQDRLGRSTSGGNMSHPELTIRGVLLPVRLGCSAEERLDPQPVEIDVTVRFEAPPRGMITDRLEDTVSFDALVQTIKEVVLDREFSLIEHLANEIFTSLRSVVGPDHELRITVRKVSPPIPEITKGADFTMGD